LIIAFHSYKGGTGKTLFSVNLASTYARKGKKVCLIELDFRAPSLSTIFKVNNPEYWVNDYLNGACEIDKVLVDVTEEYGRSGKFFVGLANPATEAIREMSAKDRKWEMRALGRLLSLKTSLLNDTHLDYVILDTSPGLQYSSINALVCADVVLMVTTLDKSDVGGTQRIISELGTLFEKKTEVIANKVPYGFLPSKNRKKKQIDLETLQLPIVGTMPCSCDMLNAGGEYFFASEKPNHPFTKTLEKIAKKIEHY
jgi:MinD-like ATPase involved in chromosome partitioning or flagellar assembly